jgi:hypothetical protein
MFEEGEADTARHLELDSAKEIRCNILFQSARYLQGVHRYHDRNVQQRSFNVGDMVLRRIQDDTGLHKLIDYSTRMAFHCVQGHRPWILSITVLGWPGGTKLMEY